MTARALPWYSRIGRAFDAFFRILGDGRAAAAWPPPALPEGEAEGATPPPASVASDGAAPGRAAAPEVREDGALVLLAMLQAEGRFIDFMQQDIAAFPDADVGAVARVVHAGCRKVLAAHLRVEAIRSEPEGQTVQLAPGFDPHHVKLTGKLGGAGPIRGVLRHRGWLAKEVSLPNVMDRAGVRVLCPAEVEL